MGLFGNNKDVVAIDIGSNSIKMVQLSKNGPQYSLVRWAKEGWQVRPSLMGPS